jgi:hypothetical protein
LSPATAFLGPSEYAMALERGIVTESRTIMAMMMVPRRTDLYDFIWENSFYMESKAV